MYTDVHSFFQPFCFTSPPRFPVPFWPHLKSHNPNRACAHSIIMIRWLLITKFICALAFSCSFSPKPKPEPKTRNQGIWKLNTEH